MSKKLDFTPLSPQDFKLQPPVVAAAFPESQHDLDAWLDQLQQQTIAHVQQQVIEQLQAHFHQQYMAHLIYMVEQMNLARRRLFGRSAQIPNQPSLFDEAEALFLESNPELDMAEIPPPPPATDKKQPKARGGRSALPDTLHREVIVYDVPDAERTCPCGPMVKIGEEVSEQLDIIPMQIQVLRYVRPIYGCLTSEHAPTTAKMPPQPLPRTNASPDFLATLLANKYEDAIPLYRFESILKRYGCPVPRQTLARWVIGAATLFQPLYNLMYDEILAGRFVHCDETRVQVLGEEGKDPSSQSYMWVMAGGTEQHPVVLFNYDPSRSGKVAEKLLHDYQGFLMADAYAGYNILDKYHGIIEINCWAHVRNKFVEATHAYPNGKFGLAHEAVKFIAQLYKVEKTHKNSTEAQRLEARQQYSVPVLDKIRLWLDKHLPLVPKQSALGAALHYMHNHWPNLVRYASTGFLPIDNNRAENAIRPFVIGRKNWLFCATPAGAHASAMIYSMLQTVKLNKLDPFAWLRYVLRKLPAAQTLEDYDALLPWNLTTEQLICQLK